jgi:hypothetical protein
MKEKREKIEQALSAAIAEYALLLNKDVCEKTGESEDSADAFVVALTQALVFCSGTVMTQFLISYHVSTGEKIDPRYVESTFREIMTATTEDVCKRFPEHIKVIEKLIREKGLRPS